MKGFLKVVKEYFDSVWYSSLQAKMCVVSFACGAAIIFLCLFTILPFGEIATSALQAAGMFLILAGAFGGVKVAFDLLNNKFTGQIADLTSKLADAVEKNKNEKEDE